MKRTAEFVTPKHPDKLADRIADTLVDLFMGLDKNARVAAEVLAGHGDIHVIGEVTVKGHNQQEINDMSVDAIRVFIKNENLPVPFIDVRLDKQSEEIAQGVDIGGAGDQGIVYGMASRETENTGEYLPLDYCLARSLCQHLYEKWPEDGKTQITIDGKTITTIVASFANAEREEIESEIRHWLIKICSEYQVQPATPLEILANPAGNWCKSGWDADTGLTGRKLAVDNYGGACPCGGGAYSGKDPSKTDRSAAYMTRYISKNVLQNARRTSLTGNPVKPSMVQTKLAYAIGKAEPVDATVLIRWEDGATTTSEIADFKESGFDFDVTPNGIIETLKLKDQHYAKTAEWGAYGHKELTWEQTNGQ